MGTWCWIWPWLLRRPVGVTSLRPLWTIPCSQALCVGACFQTTPPRPQDSPGKGTGFASTSTARISPDFLGVQDLASKLRWGWASGF